MSTVVRTTAATASVHARPADVANRYGRFSTDGAEYIITDPRTPRPWVNIIANPRFGLAISQTGSGFSWVDNSQLAVLTRWQQEFAQDASGKFLYVRDARSGQVWSLAPAPVWPAYDRYECRHGLGYTTFVTEFAGLLAEWTLFAHADETCELWRVELLNGTDRIRRIELSAYLEWCCGVAPSPRREFTKLFLETQFDRARGTIYARSLMWEVPTKSHGHWNREFPYTTAMACTEPILSAQGDKAAFFGRYGELRAPQALTEDVWKPAFGRHEDAIGALRTQVELHPGERRTLGFALAVGGDRPAVDGLLDRHLSVPAIDQALADVRAGWQERLATHRVETSEPSVNYLANDWLRYQAISGRLWGRCGYYQQSGAFGFRDQLQDSQVWLPIEPQRCRAQLNLHAAHQFADGSVYHWWHPLSEQGHVTRMTDDLLWLSFVAANYIKETGQLDVLNDAAPFIDDDQRYPLCEHVRRAFERCFGRFSPRGLPYIGAGDWNDGLSAVGLQERGESIWLAQFLVGLLADWSEIYRRTGDTARAAEFVERRTRLIATINTEGWDGDWYYGATRDDGTKLGSAENRVGRIFLNTQTWAILNDVAPPDRAAACLAAVRQHLVTEAGALLLSPAYDQPDESIGYITRYAPGLRENGGVYTHAATWAIAAAAKMRDHELVGRLLTAINPALKDPDRYCAEPYVLPGNVDGPQSPHHGRGGWTWYTGSAAWLHRVFHEWVLGVRPEWDGLRLDPCLPPGWTHARVQRPYRGASLTIEIHRRRPDGDGQAGPVLLDGHELPQNFVPAAALTASAHTLVVRC